MRNEKYKIILFYKFVKVKNPVRLMKDQRALCELLNLKGRIIIGKEGINATLEGITKNINAYKKELKNDIRFSDIKIKVSDGNGLGFPKLKVKVRDEIVTLGAGTINPETPTAKKITAHKLQKMYEKDENFIIIDLRNDYEIESGAFEKTIDAGLENFRDLPQKLSKLKKYKNKKIVAVCTGGIRCEKATKLMKKEGFSNLYQLKDGIHTYMQKYPGKNFQGTLFVFDNRMVTDVTKIENKEIVGTCTFCNDKTERYYCDDSVRPSKKLLCCNTCYTNNKEKLRNAVSAKI